MNHASGFNLVQVILAFVFGTGGLSVIGLAISTHIRVSKVKGEVDDKIGSVYKNMDRDRQGFREDYMSKELCQERTDNFMALVNRIESSIACIPDIKAGIDLLLKNNGYKKKE